MPLSPSEMSQPTLYVLEDDAEIARLICMSLGEYGFRCEHVGTGRQLLARARQSPPDLCIVDLGLPDMDGSEVAMRIKQHDSWAHIRTIAVTGDAGADAVRDPAATGFDAHVVKPFSGADLMAVIDRVFGGG